MKRKQGITLKTDFVNCGRCMDQGDSFLPFTELNMMFVCLYIFSLAFRDGILDRNHGRFFSKIDRDGR